jgi:hypothetical protein
VQDIVNAVDAAQQIAMEMTLDDGVTGEPIADLDNVVDELGTALELMGVKREEIPIEPATAMEHAIPV